MTKKFLFYLYKYELLIFSLLFLLYRYSHLRFVFGPYGFSPPGTDPYYRMHRIFQLLQNKLSFMLQDPYLHFPKGGISPWVPGMEYLIALPLKLMGLTSKTDVITACIIVMPLLGLPIIWFVKPILSRVSTSIWPRVWVYLGYIFLPSMLLIMALGRFDHHVFEAVFPMLLFVLFYSEKCAKYKVCLWTLFFFCSWFMWPHVWILNILLLPLVLTDRDPQKLQEISMGFGLSFVIQMIVFYLIAPDAFYALKISLFGVSWFPLLVNLGSCIALFDFSRLLKKQSGKKIPFLTIIGLGLFGIFFSDFIFRIFRDMLSSILADKGTLSNTTETKNFFAYLAYAGFKHDLTYMFFVPLMMVLLYVKGQAKAIIRYSVIPLILFLFQVRFKSIFFPWAVIIGVVFVWRVVDALVHGEGNNFKKKCVFVIFFAMILVPIYPQIGNPLLNHMLAFHQVKSAARFVDKDVDRKGLDRSKSAIAAAWPMGHMLMLYADLPAVATPFQGPSALEMSKFLTGEVSTQGLEEVLGKYPFRYLLLKNTPQEYVKIYMAHHKDPSNVYVLDNMGSYQVREGFLKLNVSQFMYSNAKDYIGHASGSWRVIYAFPKATLGRNQYSDVKLFERVPGAVIDFANVEKGYRLVGEISIMPSEKFTMDLPIQIRDGKQVWVVPYGAYDQEGVEFSGKYTIMDDQDNLIETVFVSETDVLEGKVLKVGYK